MAKQPNRLPDIPSDKQGVPGQVPGNDAAFSLEGTPHAPGGQGNDIVDAADRKARPAPTPHVEQQAKTPLIPYS